MTNQLDGRAILLGACQHLITRSTLMERADIEACVFMTELAKIIELHPKWRQFGPGDADAFNARLERYIYDRVD